MSKELTDTASGVANAMDFWLSQHDVSVPETIAAAVEDAMRGWLDDHAAELVAAIAEKASEGMTREDRL